MKTTFKNLAIHAAFGVFFLAVAIAAIATVSWMIHIS